VLGKTLVNSIKEKCWMVQKNSAQITLSMHAQLLYYIFFVLIKISLVVPVSITQLIGTLHNICRGRSSTL